MATYYLSSSKQRNALPTTYLPSQKLDPCPESPHFLDNMMYLNQASNAASYFKLFCGSSQSPHNSVEIPSLGSRSEAVFSMPTGDTLSAQPIGHQSNMTTGVPVDDSVIRDSEMLSRTTRHILNGEQNLQNQGLSLSLGMQLPASVNLPSSQYRYTNSGTFSFLSSHVPRSGEHGSQSKELRNAEYLSIDLAGGTYNMIQVGALNNPQCSISPKEMQSILHLYESSGFAGTIFDSKYLKAAQQLLDEVVNVHEALKPPKSDKHYDYHKLGPDSDEETDSKYNCQSMLPSMNGMPSDSHVSTTNSSGKLSPAVRQVLQSTMTKLLSMLDEVDRRYKQYYHPMQLLESSFQMVAGCEATKPYTALVHQTISRRFRCLRDAINRQLRVTRQSFGEHDDTPNGQVLPRLRYVDKQLRQQRTLQQLGVMRHSWRPQRGLPESSILILRAWLFEHFLHPYPKESEKIMLARQTDLSRTQVANWFINARVRLWKPMIEDMYNEEFCDSESGCKSAPKAARDKSWALEDGGEELHGSGASTAAVGSYMGQFSDSKPDLIPDIEMNGCTARLGFQKGAHRDDTIDCWGMNFQGSQRSKVDDHRVCPEKIMATNLTGGESLMAAAAAYDISVLGGFGVDNQMSLVLGSQRSEKDPLPVSGEMQLREDDTLASSVGLDKVDGHFMDLINQYRFGNLHMVPDFVA